MWVWFNFFCIFISSSIFVLSLKDYNFFELLLIVEFYILVLIGLFFCVACCYNIYYIMAFILVYLALCGLELSLCLLLTII